MTQPRQGSWIEAIRSNHTKTLRTGPSGGTVIFKRTEWGIGKGQWKRHVREAALQLGLKGKTKVKWIFFVSTYTGEYEGPKHLIESFYYAI